MQSPDVSPIGDFSELSLFSDDYPLETFDIDAAAAPMASKLADTIESYGSAITVDELSKILNCSKRQVYNMIANKNLPALRIGTLLRLDPGQIAAWLRAKGTVI